MAMKKSAQPPKGVVRLILGVVILVAAAGGIFFVYREITTGTARALLDENRQLRDDRDRIAKELDTAQQENERLSTALRLLKVDHRLAQIDVLSQEGSAQAGDLATHFTFVELDGQGQPLGRPRQFRVAGDVVYVESWVVKFGDEYVEMGDPLRSTSLCLFRRVFGEAQRPMDGFDLDSDGSLPAAYRNGKEPSELEQEIWKRFWELANDPDEAQKLGVRVVHGEAPFQKMVPGKRYKLLLRASGGLSIAPENLPSDAAPMASANTM
jgi:hypothetical protein